MSDGDGKPKEPDRVLLPGCPDYSRSDNRVISARYTVFTFVPLATIEQFRRFANMYFLIVGLIMAIGTYTDLFESAISPWTTLGPLAAVISFSLLIEGSAEYKRHVNDHETNNAPCVILQRADEVTETDVRVDEVQGGQDIEVDINKAYYHTREGEKGEKRKSMDHGNNVSPVAVHVAFLNVPRRAIRQGHLVLVRNRESVPADMLLLASSNDSGSAYIETSSIDGETNLKLRTSPRLPKAVLQALRSGSTTGLSAVAEETATPEEEADTTGKFETLVEATKRITRFSYLGRPEAESILEQPQYKATRKDSEEQPRSSSRNIRASQSIRGKSFRASRYQDGRYIAALTTEPPNPSVHTFQGKLTLPPFDEKGDAVDLPLDADNVLLRGAVLRNTEWIIGVAFFTGKDTKLVQNSFDTPSKFSQLDVLMNGTVGVILCIMLLSIIYLAAAAVDSHNLQFDELFYAGFNTNTSEPWPYLPHLEPPEWERESSTFVQFFFLYITLLTNFIPLSLYVTVEFVTWCMLYFIYVDQDMYDDTTNTRAVARSTIVSDLGRIEYIFSDKTGTLTQNVMRFKRCSVDGLAFGAPIQKSRPKEDDDSVHGTAFHPLRHLLVGQLSRRKNSGGKVKAGDKLTFNAEMFLRIMSLCHTVVVEEDTEKKNLAVADNDVSKKSSDGAPIGYTYQAESPDEGALVSAASNTFGFQVVSRDSNGILLRVSKPSLLQDRTFVGKLKGNQSISRLAADSASEIPETASQAIGDGRSLLENDATREETWTIMAVNKFDSDRKRMSILLRSPPELGSLPILFCKGADSSMLDPDVSEHADVMEKVAGGEMGIECEWQIAQNLGMQAHLGEFASEGLRTLVLGLRILTESECTKWMAQYKAASVSLSDRAKLLTEAAVAIETGLHIAGATAIEDKLQKNVPQTIATLEHAGIKLWVLTGDKRETAVEIGYATAVLTPKMHVTEIADLGVQHVKTQTSMEFLSLVKRGKIPEYQYSQVTTDGKWTTEFFFSELFFLIDKGLLQTGRCFNSVLACLWENLGFTRALTRCKKRLRMSHEREMRMIRTIERRRRVRDRAEREINLWLDSDEGKKERRRNPKRGDDERLSMVSDEKPEIFNRAKSARQFLRSVRASGSITQPELRDVSLAMVTADQASSGPLVDEDTLSLESFFPGDKEDLAGNFDRHRRTVLERLFAVDKEVRKGQLRKHVFPEKLAAADEGQKQDKGDDGSHLGPRALVIEGAALKHLLGDPELEEILFAVAKSCDAVIACRVSPKQKALLVNLVRQNVVPTPITLAIGDGANDVGMIQEAHVGIGISGKEGKQAVNASDFSISQFRFLRELILIHGRWDFFRLSTVVLFSFYKNAILAGTLITFASRTLYSGTPLFDEWLIACLNFVSGIPIIILGLFDRCLSKEYVLENPEVFKATRENELITTRTLTRWVVLVFVHIFTIYYFTIPTSSGGGGNTSAFLGLMRNEASDRPGEGEGGDLKSVGSVTFTCFVVLLAYKVLYESRTMIHGVWPAFTCRKDVGEGFFSRVAYTWHGVTGGSIGFYLIGISLYQLLGRIFTSSFSPFLDITNHILGTRSINWMLFAFVPICGITFDICGKLFSNLFYPTQTQIHLEIEQKQRALAAKKLAEDETILRLRESETPDPPSPIHDHGNTQLGGATVL